MVKMEQELLILNMKAFSLNVLKNWEACLFLHILKEQVNLKIRTDTRRFTAKLRDLLQHRQQAYTLQKNYYVKQMKKAFELHMLLCTLESERLDLLVVKKFKSITCTLKSMK